MRTSATTSFPSGVARLDRAGRDVSVVTYGGGVHLARDAADAVAADGIDVEILDLRTLHPARPHAIARTVGRTGRLLVLHEANRTMGFGAEIAAFAAEELFSELDAPIRRVAAADCHLTYNPAEQGAILPSLEALTAAIRAMGSY